jgi:hypothetical protein
MFTSAEFKGRAVLLGALAAAALAAGCASDVPRPDAELARAKTLIDQAEQAGAVQYAQPDISQARDKLSAADKAAEKGDNETAQRLAAEASLDAQLALTRANSGKAKTAAAEVNQSVETLRREANRNTGVTQQ